MINRKRDAWVLTTVLALHLDEMDDEILIVDWRDTLPFLNFKWKIFGKKSIQFLLSLGGCREWPWPFRILLSETSLSPFVHWIWCSSTRSSLLMFVAFEIARAQRELSVRSRKHHTHDCNCLLSQDLRASRQTREMKKNNIKLSVAKARM